MKVIGSVIIGTVVAIVTFIGLRIVEFFVYAYGGYTGPDDSIKSIAIGEGYSINLIAKETHPFLAEYDQTLEIYRGGRNNGKLLDNVQILTNTGGRVRVGIFIPREGGIDRLVLLQRAGMSEIDLNTMKLSTTYFGYEERYDQISTDLIFLGWISGAANPMKFIPCSAWPSLSVEDQYDIVDNEKELLDLCRRFRAG